MVILGILYLNRWLLRVLVSLLGTRYFSVSVSKRFRFSFYISANLFFYLPSSKVSGPFWAVCVFLRRATPNLRQKAENQRSGPLKLSPFSGFRSFTNCIIRALNHHRVMTLPSLCMVLNSSCKSFSRERKKGWRPRPLDLLWKF